MSTEAVRAKERLDAFVDGSILARIERHTVAYPVRHHEISTQVRVPRIHLDPNDWRAGFLAVKERTLPPQLHRDLETLTPQALLRDLARPSRPADHAERDRCCEPLDPGGRRALREAKAALIRDPIPTVEAAVRTVMGEQRRRHRFMLEPWQPIRGDEEPRRRIEEYIEPSLSHRNY